MRDQQRASNLLIERPENAVLPMKHISICVCFIMNVSFLVSLNEKTAEAQDSRELARSRWRKAIIEQIILIRMERENRNLECKIMHSLHL